MASPVNTYTIANSIYGLRITFSPNCLEKTQEPIKKHLWDGKKETENYHKRTQKKWNKRFGFVMVPCIFKTPFGLVAHPALRPEIEKAARQI